jgi:GxxExxY protein
MVESTLVRPKLKHDDVTDKILHVFFKRVYPALGPGFLEKVYRNAMALALRSDGLKVDIEFPIRVFFEEQVVGEYYGDLLVEEKVIVELKACENLNPDHEAQLLNYLRATPYEVGLLLNFGKKASFRRKAFDNERKTSITWVTSIK